MYGNTHTRLDALRAVCKRYHVETEDESVSSTEDLEPYFSGEEEIHQFVAVTESHGSGHALTYAYPDFDSAEAAQQRALRHVNDDIYPEGAVAVVDLDAGTVLRPSDVSATWSAS